MHTDLWNFALHLYARPGVEAACLALQDEGADVCLLLCGAWLEAGRAGVTPSAYSTCNSWPLPGSSMW